MEQNTSSVQVELQKSAWFMQWTITWTAMLDILVPLGVTFALLFTGNAGRFLGVLIMLWIVGVWKQLSFMQSRAEFIAELATLAQQHPLTHHDMHRRRFFLLLAEILLVYSLLILVSSYVLQQITVVAWHNAITTGTVLLAAIVAVGVCNACWHFISASRHIRRETPPL